MPKIVAKTTILCGHQRHRVLLLDDGTLRSEHCAHAVQEAKRLGALASLGGHIGEVRGCAGLIALCSIGLPSLIERRGATQVQHLGVWIQTFILYEQNSITKMVMAACADRRDAKHREALQVARTALLCTQSVRRYWPGRSADDESPADLVEFIPESDVYPGQIVAESPWSQWTVPLQKDWLESIGKAKPFLDGHFLIGYPADKPGFFFGLEREDDGVIRVREFALINGKLGKVALP